MGWKSKSLLGRALFLAGGAVAATAGTLAAVGQPPKADEQVRAVQAVIADERKVTQVKPAEPAPGAAANAPVAWRFALANAQLNTADAARFNLAVAPSALTCAACHTGQEAKVAACAGHQYLKLVTTGAASDATLASVFAANTEPKALVAYALANQKPAEPSRWIGVSTAAADATLRAQLKLAKDIGVVLTNVEKATPAAAAGLQLHDIVTAVGGKPATRPEQLAEAVKAAGDKPLTLTLVRAGQPLTVTVTPAARPDPNATTFWTYNHFHQPQALAEWTSVNTFAHDSRVQPSPDRLAQVEQKLDRLAKTLERLERAFKPEAGPAKK